MNKKRLKIKVELAVEQVSAIYTSDGPSDYILLFSHGAGAPMTHPFMEFTSDSLAKNGIANLRFNFAYMESGRRSPDRKPAALSVIGAAVRKAEQLFPDKKFILGGKSFGGRMSSHYMAETNDDRIAALMYFGFPLHAPGKDGIERAAHLKDIKVPMLFLQGTRDKLANLELMNKVVNDLTMSDMIVYEGADHSFNMLKRSGITQEEIIERMSLDCAHWLERKSI